MSFVMAYTVLARRYRSQSFGSVVGQEPIASTLINAISSQRVAHAYLFCGTRGVGKTSMARIFARAINAPATIDDAPEAPGAAYPPDDIQQRMADAIMRGEDLNVIEIDGASNNSVDQARQLIANAGLSPTAHALYKIYIIDEVHMLSGAAFNALLKTMEEPPEHVKFILCTTEPHKVPATIQSRCQRFDFRNIATAKIADHLREVLQRESVDAEAEVVWQVARLGHGSMRDALSLMDRLLATGESPLTAAALQAMLGLPDHELIAAFVDALADGDLKASLTAVADLLHRGIAQDQLVEVLIERFRQLMLLAACGPDSDLVELSEDAKPAAVKQAQRFDAPGLVHMIALCENLQRFGKSSSNPRALLDATVVRLALAEKMADVAAVLAGQAALPVSADQKKKLTVDPASRPDAASGPAAPSRAPRPTGAAPSTARPPADAGPEGSLGVASSSPEPPAHLDPADPAAIWKVVLDTIGQTNAAAWMDHFRLQAIRADRDPAVALLVPTMTFAGGVKNVATGPRLQRVADTLTQLLGRKVRVEAADKPPPRPDDPPDPQTPATDTPSAPGPTAGSARHVDRRDALNLPLVREVFDVFPDASLIDARRADPPPPASLS
ncbi:MAG: DNA polymerase III subunit gamma/tau [Planctomycetota bacterium]